jgi:hypothetical protein
MNIIAKRPREEEPEELCNSSCFDNADRPLEELFSQLSFLEEDERQMLEMEVEANKRKKKRFVEVENLCPVLPKSIEEQIYQELVMEQLKRQQYEAEQMAFFTLQQQNRIRRNKLIALARKKLRSKASLRKTLFYILANRYVEWALQVLPLESLQFD